MHVSIANAVTSLQQHHRTPRVIRSVLTLGDMGLSRTQGGAAGRGARAP